MNARSELFRRLDALATVATPVSPTPALERPPANTLKEALQEVEQPRTGLELRTVIGQATGLIAERYSLHMDTAFAVLTRLSNELNVKLFVVATKIVRDRDSPPEGILDLA